MKQDLNFLGGRVWIVSSYKNYYDISNVHPVWLIYWNRPGFEKINFSMSYSLDLSFPQLCKVHDSFRIYESKFTKFSKFCIRGSKCMKFEMQLGPYFEMSFWKFGLQVSSVDRLISKKLFDESFCLGVVSWDLINFEEFRLILDQHDFFYSQTFLV